MEELLKRVENFIEKQRAGLVPKKIKETVHRGGKTFIRERTVMAKPEDISEKIKAEVSLLGRYSGMSDKDLLLLGRKNLESLSKRAKELAERNRSLAQFPPSFGKDWDKWREEHKKLASNLEDFSHKAFMLSIRSKR